MSYLFRLVALAALFGLLFGFDEGVIAGALPLITKTFHISVTAEGFLTAAVPLGAVLGAILAAACADWLGRRKVLILCSICFVGGAIASGLATGQLGLIHARLVLGIAIGASALAAPMFLAELAPAKSRGAGGSAQRVFVFVSGRGSGTLRPDRDRAGTGKPALAGDQRRAGQGDRRREPPSAGTDAGRGRGHRP